ncbi:MAG: transglycosylase SLT domain-containing protein [Myxococcota bacterium]
MKVIWVVSFTAWLVNSAEGLAQPLFDVDPAQVWFDLSQQVPLPLGPQGFRTTALAARHILVLAVSAPWWSTIHRAPGRRRGAGFGTWLLASVLFLVAFVPLGLQPTLVAPTFTIETLRERVTHLVDGTAVFRALDAWLSVGREVYEEPEAVQQPVDATAFDATLESSRVPLMDRWDPVLLAAAKNDLDLFADTKAVMFVESSGKQYAVSPTGCAGLMQFCVGTAQRAPFRQIFGAGGVSACGCTDCSVPWPVQVALESDPAAIDDVAAEFPCDLTDARFDAEKSIKAGVAYVRELNEDLGDNLLLVYVGYNAGPAVARRLHKTVGSQATLAQIRPQLEPALRPWYGSRAPRMARLLGKVNLPKLQNARRRFAAQSKPPPVARPQTGTGEPPSARIVPVGEGPSGTNRAE